MTSVNPIPHLKKPFYGFASQGVVMVQG